MSKFIFQLEGVLRHRKHLEQNRQRELALVQAQMAQLQQQLQTLDQTVQATTNQVRQHHLTGRLDMNFLAAHRRYVFAMERQALALAQKMALVQRQVEQAQKNLAEAAKQRKVIEKLRERCEGRWREDQNRREMMQQDEISMQLSYDARKTDPWLAAEPPAGQVPTPPAE